VQVARIDRNKEKSKEFVKYVRGTRKHFVKLLMTLDGTGELIECATITKEEAEEERKSTSAMDGPGHEEKQGIC
jgi:hypothetical protein